MKHAEPGLSRRSFLGASALALAPAVAVAKKPEAGVKVDVAAIDRARILKGANQYLKEAPLTITASSSPRSSGGKHDFFSEGDYWWPDPANPEAPYIQRDGMSNPDNFVGHRKALMRLSVQMPSLAAAYLVTKQRKYADHAAKHLRAWFMDPETMMAPHLKYSQAIKGRFTGRGTGIIDTLHLVEVARATSVLEAGGALSPKDRDGVKQWFADYLKWLTTHEYGIGERNAKNNHGTCWVMQAAEFARLTGNAAVTSECRDRYKKIFVPGQFAADGSFPEELRRTKPYGYSLFNIDIMSTVCQILSTPEDNLWTYEHPDGRGMRKAMAFIYPFILDKKTWPKKPDVMYWDNWPVRHPCLIFGGLGLGQADYIALWKKLDPDPTVEEVIRNYPVRQPVLWVGR